MINEYKKINTVIDSYLNECDEFREKIKYFNNKRHLTIFAKYLKENKHNFESIPDLDLLDFENYCQLINTTSKLNHFTRFHNIEKFINLEMLFGFFIFCEKKGY